MSALTPIANKRGCGGDVRFVPPLADSCSAPRKINSLTRSAVLATLAVARTQSFALLLCVAAGAAYAISVLPVRVLNPLDISWITGDPAQSYLGWLYFRREESLALPLGWATTLGYPLGEPIAYLDSIPPVATALWFFRHLLPVDFQYLGAYFVACCVLQCYFGFRICRTFAKDNWLVCLLGAMFFLTSAVFTWRALGHYALVSHWLILAALERFLTRCRLSSTPNILYVGALCFIAGSISPYITAMVLLIVAAAYMQMVRPAGWSRMVAAMTIAIGAAVASLLLFGFLRPDGFQYAGERYGFYSMNLLAPINPVYPGALLLPVQKMGPGQYEGYNYLGLGLIILAVAAVARRPDILRRLMSREALFGWCIVVVSLMLALSTTLTAGSLVLRTIPVPDALNEVLSAFRCSGRFFWPAYYLIMAGVLAGTYLAFGRYSPLVLLAAFLIQVVDLAPLRAKINKEFTVSRALTVPDNEPAWRSLGSTHKHLVVVPPYQCDRYMTPGGFNGYWLFGKLAADQQMTINSFYPSRNSAKQQEFFCNAQIRQIERDGMAPDTAYVINPSYMMQIGDEALRDHRCDRLGSMALCLYHPGGGGRDPALAELLPVVEIGKLVEFGSANPDVRSFATISWDHFEQLVSMNEPDGRWMLGPEATMILRLPVRPDGLDLHLDIVSFLPPDHSQRVDIQVGGRLLAQWRFDMKNADDVDRANWLRRTPQTLHIASRDLGPNGVVVLRFALPDAVSLQSLGRGSDARKPGIKLRSFRVTEAERRG